MSSSHCLGKSRDSRRERVSIRRATVPSLASENADREVHRLIDAVNTQEYDRVLDLLQSGCDPRTPDKHGRTPLHVASTKLDATIVKSLLDHGADVDAEDSLGNTALHLACISGRIAIVGVLLRAGADLSAGVGRATPLTLALSRLQSMMNERRTISSPEVKMEIQEVIHLLKKRSTPSTNFNSLTDLCEQFENLDFSFLSNLTMSLYKNVHL